MKKNIVLKAMPIYGRGEVFWRTKDSTLESVKTGITCNIPPMKLTIKRTFVVKA
jgi:hypothetical protein